MSNALYLMYCIHSHYLLHLSHVPTSPTLLLSLLSLLYLSTVDISPDSKWLQHRFQGLRIVQQLLEVIILHHNGANYHLENNNKWQSLVSE